MNVLFLTLLDFGSPFALTFFVVSTISLYLFYHFYAEITNSL